MELILGSQSRGSDTGRPSLRTALQKDSRRSLTGEPRFWSDWLAALCLHVRLWLKLATLHIGPLTRSMSCMLLDSWSYKGVHLPGKWRCCLE